MQLEASHFLNNHARSRIPWSWKKCYCVSEGSYYWPASANKTALEIAEIAGIKNMWSDEFSLTLFQRDGCIRVKSSKIRCSGHMRQGGVSGVQAS